MAIARAAYQAGRPVQLPSSSPRATPRERGPRPPRHERQAPGVTAVHRRAALPPSDARGADRICYGRPMQVLVLNAGSSSLKYQLVDPATGHRTLAGTIEALGAERSYDDALREVLARLEGAKVDAVGHRVVHGGARFVDAVRVDDEVLAAIEAQVPLAPLHNPANLAGIRAARALLPGVPHVAVFDTAFHVRMPRRARTYAIDPELAEAHGLRRYGFHGTSHRFVAGLAAEHLRRPLAELRVVSLHLGNGASACAIEHGHSVDTSMGLTPLEGLVMGTRSGDVDPGIVLKLARELGADGAEAVLNDKKLSRRHNFLRGVNNLQREVRRGRVKWHKTRHGQRLPKRVGVNGGEGG